MRLANCKNCNKVFRTEKFDLCEECRIEEQRKIGRIRDFVEANEKNDITVELISEKTKVDITEIYSLFKKGKLICLNGSVRLKCQVCGAEIKGRTIFCSKCKNDIQAIMDCMNEEDVNENGLKKKL